MPPTQDNFDRDSQAQLPPGLVDDLRGLYAAPRLPAARDQAILSASRAALARRGSLRLFMRWGTGVAVAAAAAVLLLVWPGHLLRHPAPQSPIANAPEARQLTILDALALSRKIAATPPAQRPREWDINGDGKVDEADARALAERVVSLKGEAVQ